MSVKNRGARQAVKSAGPDRMLHYPADFTPCGCGVYNHCGIAAALVSRHGDTMRAKAIGRICETCGATWRGDVKRHRGMPLVPSSRGIVGSRGIHE